MALVQERPSESSAGNPGCLSENKCECVRPRKRLVGVVIVQLYECV